MKKSRKNEGILLVAVSAVSYGLMPIFAKIAYSAGTSIYTLLFLRFLVATVFMFLLIFIKKLPLPTKKEILTFLLLGALGYVGVSFCYFAALNYASASIVALLQYTYPAMVLIGSVLLLKEKASTFEIISLFFALAGASVISGRDFAANSLGIILAILSTILYSVYILINSRVAKEGMGVQSSAFIMLGTTLVYGILNSFVGFAPPTEPAGFAAIFFDCNDLNSSCFLVISHRHGENRSIYSRSCFNAGTCCNIDLFCDLPIREINRKYYYRGLSDCVCIYNHRIVIKRDYILI